MREGAENSVRQDFVVAAVQMVSTGDLQRNLDTAAGLLQRAAGQGARLVVLPENFASFPVADAQAIAAREQEPDGPIRTFLREQARALDLWLVGGSMPFQAVSGGPVFASSFVVDSNGYEQGRYDKMHLFDVDVAGDSQPRYRESEDFAHGAAPLVLDLPFCRLGVMICYDLRFPELSRAMALQGMDVLAVPAAFTATTGRAHWELLLRARAVENLSWVIAADQGGTHPGGRQTWGHSMLVSPWGDVQTQCAAGEQVVVGTIDRARGTDLRRDFPVLQHVRMAISPSS